MNDINGTSNVVLLKENEDGSAVYQQGEEHMTRKELMADGTQYCCYCGCEKVRFQCCGENHFQTLAEMSAEERQEFLDDEELT